MKYRNILLIGLFLSQLAWAAGKEIKIRVNGMVCAFCAQGITKKFKNEPSVEKVDVKLSDKIVTLTLKDSRDISDQQIREILESSGYNVQKIER